MFDHLHRVIDQTFHDWNHGLTAVIGMGVLSAADELAGKLLGLTALVVGITCSIRREIRESRAARARSHS